MFEGLKRKVATSLIPELSKQLIIDRQLRLSSFQYPGMPIYSEMTVQKATREGYKISPYVYRAVRTIIQACSAVPWLVVDPDGEPIAEHPLAKVLQKPNPEFSGQDLIEFLIAHLELVGNALWQPIIVGNQVKEIWIVMPDLVKPIPADIKGEWLKGWEVTEYGGSHHIVPASQFIHFMQVDPANPYWGISPLMAVARTIDVDNEAVDTQKISMQNRGVVDGVFTHESPLTAEQFEEARRQIRENYLTKSRRREPWVLGAGSKWQQMSLTPVEMDYIASRIRNLRDIAGAFGISPIFLGDLEQSSYDNMKQARKSLYEDVAIPLLDDIKATLNLKLAPLYNDIIITYDVSTITALREDYGAKVEQAHKLWSMGLPFDQINSRLGMGFEEFHGWDTGYLPITLLPTGSPAPISEKQAEPKTAKKSAGLETEEYKARYWKMIDSRRVGWWGVLDKRFKALYDQEAKEVEKAMRNAKSSELVDEVRKAINGLRPTWEKTMTASLGALIEDFGKVVAEELGGQMKSDRPIEKKWIFNPFSSVAMAWIASHGAESITSILSTNRDAVKQIISAGWEENLSTPEIGRKLRQFYIDGSPFKAMRVARTEVGAAASWGQREAAKQSGIIKGKRWLSSRDERVRDSHVSMDGEEQKLDAPYSNGLMFPGDSSGPTEEFIMCRCVEQYLMREPKSS